MDVNQSNEVGRDMQEQMVQDLHQHGINFERVAIDQLLNPIDEDDIIEPVPVENQLVQQKALKGFLLQVWRVRLRTCQIVRRMIIVILLTKS